MNISKTIKQIIKGGRFRENVITPTPWKKIATPSLRNDETAAYHHLAAATLQLSKLCGWEYQIEKNLLHCTCDYIDWLPEIKAGKEGLYELLSSIHPEEQEALQRKIKMALTKATGFDASVRKLNPEGKEIWVRIICHTRHNDGKPVSLQGTIQEITTQKRKELRRLKQSLMAQYQLLYRTQWEHENELGRIAVDLHENISQVLIVARNYLQTDLIELRTADSYQDKGIKIVEKAIHEIKGLYEKIETPPIHLLGLEGALIELLERFNQQSPTQLSLIVFDGSIERADELIKLTLIRLAKELLSNILHHAKAAEGWISLELVEKGIILTVKDDGIGFYPDKQQWRTGLCKAEIMTAVLGGRLQLNSSPGKGCDVVVEIPWSLRKLFTR